MQRVIRRSALVSPEEFQTAGGKKQKRGLTHGVCIKACVALVFMTQVAVVSGRESEVVSDGARAFHVPL